MEKLSIETVSEKNIEEVLPLVRLYLEFYKVTNISDKKNREFFLQFGKDSSLGCQFLYRQEGKVVAFATVYFTFATSIAARVAVLNDLYTLPEARGQGIGRSLIAHCREYAGTSGAARLQWLTAADNYNAQKLYDSLEANRSDWVFYTSPV